jgi:cysteinyl-tRNA synthetase
MRRSMRSPVRLTNTYSRTLEEFQPLRPGAPIRLYSCGPTVYSFAHIGNFRTFLMADLLRRVLERAGHQVRHVMNITDVGHMTQDHLADAHGEDKLAKAARELGWDPYHVAQHFLTAFEADARALRLRNYAEAEGSDPTRHPRATRYIPEMLSLIQKLIEGEHAYVDSNGQVYFSIESFPEYGQLSGKVIDELEVGARVEVREEKRDPRDFALWKVDSKHLMQWDPHNPEGWPPEDWQRLQQLLPAGLDARVKKGFPGWHIECSAMSLACLGDTIDLHTGGEDNVFPHHECEIAQSCAALGVEVPGPTGPRRSFSRYWVHSKHLMVESRKMSKRDGTFFTVRELLDPVAADRPELAEKLVEAGFESGKVAAPVLRLGLMWSHYRAPLNFSFDLLTQARNAVGRLQSLYERACEMSGGGAVTPAVQQAIDAGMTAFDEALADDLNMERAMAAVLDTIGKLNQQPLAPADGPVVKAALEDLDQILDVLVRRRMGMVEKARLGAAEMSAEETEALKARASSGELDEALIEQLVLARQSAKKRKDFAAADGLRAFLKERGVVLEDLPAGVRWKTS